MRFSIVVLLVSLLQYVTSTRSINQGGSSTNSRNGGHTSPFSLSSTQISDTRSFPYTTRISSESLETEGSSSNGASIQMHNGKKYSNIITKTINLNTDLNHLVVDTITGRVFVGGVNYLYQLSPQLELHEIAKTGPHNDPGECSFLDCAVQAEHKPTNNYNKVLLIDRATPRLITCGSLYQGTCTVRSLQNVSIVEEEVSEMVVANDKKSSTVAFIGPGPLQHPISNVLYVGVTNTNNSPYRSEIPAVASRSLEKTKMLQIASSTVRTGTRAFINSNKRETYLVNYVYGFSSERFSYFLTTQLKHNHHLLVSQPKEYITKLVRICQEDLNYYSYTEIPVDCTSDTQGGTKYNLVQAGFLGKPSVDLAESLGITVRDDVLYAVFSAGRGNVSTDKSALCIYSLKSIRRKFMQNIKSCHHGVGVRGLDFMAPNAPCILTKLQIDEGFCGIDVNSPLGGKQPITAVPVAVFNTTLTAVAATSTSGHTVVFIGTGDGYLKKVVVESSTSANEYAHISIKVGSPINADLQFDSQNSYIYVMSRRQVAKVKVFDCSVYTTCGECLGARDPYCGWCYLENICSPRSSCQDAPKDPLYWVSYKTGKCPIITSVTPHQLQRSTIARTLELVIDNLPQVKEDLVCAFTINDQTLFTNAQKRSNGVDCVTPRTEMLPQIEQGKHHFTAKLSVRTRNGPDLVSTDFTFYDCGTLSSCTRCVSSEFPCDWCVEAHRCTHDTAENCRNDILVAGVHRIGLSYRSGTGFCPAIYASDDASELLVAAGSRKSIKVKVHINGLVGSRLVCQLNIEGRVTSLSSQLLGDTLYCDSMDFEYTSRSPSLTATFGVIWGGSKPLDNPHDIHVIIYRCRDLANSCGMCLALPGKYNCRWCASTNTCEVEEQCNDPKNDWLNRMEYCLIPEIHSFSPKTGPWEGGTNITIRGINLGKNFADIYSGVRIAGINCMPLEQYYITTEQIVCTVDSPGAYRSGRIVVQIGDYRCESKEDYEFVDPTITSFSPRYGSLSGGTKIHISGRYLNAGSLIKAYINEHPCEILNADATQAICRTAPSKAITEGRLKMVFDNARREFSQYSYIYIPDQTIPQVCSDPSMEYQLFDYIENHAMHEFCPVVKRLFSLVRVKLENLEK